MKRGLTRPKMIADMIVPDDADKHLINTYYSFVYDKRIDPMMRNEAGHPSGDDAAASSPEKLQRLAQEYIKEHVKFVSVSPTSNAIPTEPPDLAKPSTATIRLHGSVKLKVTPQAKQEYTPAPRATPTIELPPGYRIAAIANFVLTKGAYQRYVAPHIADMQFEYIEAIKKCDERLAQWVRVRGYGLIIWALLGSVLKSLITRLVPSAK